MKKIIFSIIIFFLLQCCTIFASFLNNSNYVKIMSDIEANIYVDSNSTKSIRYEPPYYIIEGKMFYEFFGSPEIFATTNLFYYDYSTRKVRVKGLNISAYSPDGTLLKIENKPSAIIDVSAKTHISTTAYSEAANFYFIKCYNKPFYR
ncbi:MULTISPECIES: hypothetical protein [Megasphaera]|uniref:hypothetical protein n=1 Tax=Megasphaera TaxID=906 RepID=UPI0008225F53|nr:MULTISPECIES: hypothetical protein [Megasphaera]MCU6714493.1 hypothetical protein [Megasphaera butyrica]SCH59428.1 Uncharacterised protein [uncultured Megasphaera sp.]SCJ02297.1 Uncharacterised protein [uncultured Ruminococcus sp.]